MFLFSLQYFKGEKKKATLKKKEFFFNAYKQHTQKKCKNIYYHRNHKTHKDTLYTYNTKKQILKHQKVTHACTSKKKNKKK